MENSPIFPNPPPFKIEIHCDADDRDRVKLERIGACAAITTLTGTKAGLQVNVSRKGIEEMIIWLAECLMEIGNSIDKE